MFELAGRGEGAVIANSVGQNSGGLLFTSVIVIVRFKFVAFPAV